jgi:hypothetical protein
VHRLVRIGSHPLDRGHSVPLGLHREHETGAYGFPVEKYGARTAGALLASDVRTGQAAGVADEVTEQEPWLHCVVVSGAVDVDGDGSGVHEARGRGRP